MAIGQRDAKVKIKLGSAGTDNSVVVNGVEIRDLVVSVTVTRDQRGYTTAVLELIGVELDAETEQAIATILPRDKPQQVA